MKLLEHFKTFLESHVNLNSTRISLLEDSIGAVKSAVRASSWGAKEPAHKSNSSTRCQKNWRSGTANFIHSQSICGIDDALGIIIRRKLDNRRIAGERPRRVRVVFVRAGGVNGDSGSAGDS